MPNLFLAEIFCFIKINIAFNMPVLKIEKLRASNEKYSIYFLIFSEIQLNFL